MKLVNRSKNIEVVGEVEVAESYLSRLIGLLGRRGYPENRALWLKPCHSIHTWFMLFSIDVVFVDKNMKVIALYPKLKPWRMTSPFLRAASIFEMAAGTLNANLIELGDELHVGN